MSSTVLVVDDEVDLLFTIGLSLELAGYRVLKASSGEEALTMSTLAEDSVEPYRTIFSDHRRAFLELAAEIRLASGYQAALGATARLTMPSLVDWLQ